MMNAQIIYFSATGTTRKIVEAFARGLNCEVRFSDITHPQNRKEADPIESDLVVIALPVYRERIPGFIYHYLEKLDGKGKPLVALPVYGNVGYGVSLIQFAEYAATYHFRLIAAGTFVGEHSFASEKTPIAYGRPDPDDLAEAEAFGKRVREKYDAGNFGTVAVTKQQPPLLIALMSKMPDSFVRFLVKQPRLNKTICTRCGACAKKCPVGAIAPDTLQIDEKKCVRCFACVKGCPRIARNADFRFKLFALVFNRLGKKRRQNRVII